MTRQSSPTPLSEFDLMMIRAGGRTEAELEALAKNGFGFSARGKVCAFLADMLYRAVVVLEAGAHRSAESSHRRLVA
ncbi:hypothetical protein [Boseongicola aestuarii]|uniref:Uncharacterized protein n=1 Tax=Boseongicola aestuarii TaxID=1470561 RepID=A0A238J785_9RHOB|nr:hypothetical protein [Boseongicola aestuarii]SMX25734.1 hypothetical protein BOA8489_03878 [Boseongicola aestuarii]